MRHFLASLFLCLCTFSSVFAAPPRSIAIWPFDTQSMNQSMAVDTSSFLENALPDVVMMELLQSPSLRMVERQKLLDVLREQKLGSSDLVDDETRIKLGRIMGANLMVFGNYMRMLSNWRLDIRIVSVETTQVLATATAEGTNEDVLAVTRTAAQTLLNKMGSSVSAGSNFPAPLWAQYEKAMQLIKEKKLDEASRLLEDVLKKEPKFLPAEQKLTEILLESARQ